MDWWVVSPAMLGCCFRRYAGVVYRFDRRRRRAADRARAAFRRAVARAGAGDEQITGGRRLFSASLYFVRRGAVSCASSG